MKIAKSCMICEEKIAQYRCIICGRLVCGEHYVISDSMCTACHDGIVV